MNKVTTKTTFGCFATMTGVAIAASPVIDGSLDAIYGSSLSTQTVQTNFGDNASELNAGYAHVEAGNLYLFLSGNIEANFNKLNIFIDSVAGGQNTIAAASDEGGTNPNNDVSLIDLNNFSGNQYFEIAVPEPSSTLLMACGVLGLLIPRRRP